MNFIFTFIVCIGIIVLGLVLLLFIHALLHPSSRRKKAFELEAKLFSSDQSLSRLRGDIEFTCYSPADYTLKVSLFHVSSIKGQSLDVKINNQVIAQVVVHDDHVRFKSKVVGEREQSLIQEGATVEIYFAGRVIAWGKFRYD